jgi:hypothetical protein
MQYLRANPHKAAALTYAGLGLLVIGITFAAGLVPAAKVMPMTSRPRPA